MTALPDRGGFAALDACVHCGFCLQACPTFLVTGDEADGPRGRIELMRSLEQHLIAPDDPDLQLHLDRCLGCRGCEPVCPSGVGYGRGLEAARERMAETRSVPVIARLALWLLTTPGVSRVVYAFARLLRATGIPRRLAGTSRIGFSMGMLDATRGDRLVTGVDDSRLPTPAGRALLFSGCIMDGLFSHVHAATIRTLGVNGFRTGTPAGQVCCGALHAHAGMTGAARDLARRNVEAFGAGDEPIVVNSAGCGALLKDYGHLLPDDPAASRFAARVRDVSELLASAGPVPGGRIEERVAYDPPCHLVHAQRVADAPLKILKSIPGLRLIPVADAEKCCGSAGLYTVVEPGLSRSVLAGKITNLEEAGLDLVLTGNPGCVMQIGAGLAATERPVPVRHPVELLDRAYALAGRYG
ncbi:MAG TPA: heterodisulfide reductase-related iron-sulfur binding cluster [Gemmatimonadales bacterium]|jgi:glycolate oxidase iron-sulfur subunit|nr:heterodisulfide reductase-related iron-sulfur binding cluster [Gemmatimonadales bacterium]